MVPRCSAEVLSAVTKYKKERMHGLDALHLGIKLQVILLLAVSSMLMNQKNILNEGFKQKHTYNKVILIG